MYVDLKYFYSTFTVYFLWVCILNASWCIYLFQKSSKHANNGSNQPFADHVSYEWGIVSKHEFSVKFVLNKEYIAQIYVTPEYQSVKGTTK
jgi:hypothetical protein